MYCILSFLESEAIRKAAQLINLKCKIGEHRCSSFFVFMTVSTGFTGSGWGRKFFDRRFNAGLGVHAPWVGSLKPVLTVLNTKNEELLVGDKKSRM